MEEDKFDFVEFLRILNNWKKPVITVFLLVSIITAVISLFLTKYYTAEAVIIPPEKESSTSLMSSMISRVPLSGLMGFGRGDNTNFRYMAILQSRTLLEKICNEFNLKSVYETEDMEKTVRTLRGFTKLVINEDNTLAIRVTDKSPERSADITNTFIKQLDEENRRLKGEEAKNFRIFIEDRYNKNKDELKAAEENFSAFQKKYNAVSVTEQTAQSIEIAAGLLSNVYQLEIQYTIQEKILNKDHSELVRLKNEINAIKDKLKEISFNENNLVKVNKKDPSSIIIPFSEIPKIGMEYVRLMREVETRNQIHILMTEQYELAKMEEAKNTPTLQIIDKAVPPIRKSRPKRAFIVLAAGFSSLILMVLFALVKEYFRKIQL